MNLSDGGGKIDVHIRDANITILGGRKLRQSGNFVHLRSSSGSFGGSEKQPLRCPACNIDNTPQILRLNTFDAGVWESIMSVLPRAAVAEPKAEKTVSLFRRCVC